MPKTTLHVLDGTAALFRAYYGMNKLSAPDGREVGGTFGFCQSLSRFVRVVRPTHAAVVFDTEATTYRHDLYPEYKANRTEPPEDMVHQFELAFVSAQALGFLCYRIPGYEADDLMATMAYRGRRAGIRTILVTPDKDVCQLIDANVLVMDPRSYELADQEAVVLRFGVSPANLPDVQALAGDATDNIPGVAGVGLKTAVRLVQALGNLDAIYARLDEVAELDIRGAKSIAKKLEDGRRMAYLSRELVRLNTDAPLSKDAMTLGMLRYRGPREDADVHFEEVGYRAPLQALRRQFSGRG
jgi:DNA polymerase-1